MDKYDIKGMSCASCSARVEKAVKGVEGVEECSVNLLTNSMTVKGSASPETIIDAVEKAGYGAELSGNNKTAKKEKDISNKAETKGLILRLISSVVLLLVLMYFSMGAMMWNFPVPKVFESCISQGVIQLVLCLVILFINRKFFINGIKGVIHKSPNMDTLVALGSGVSFGYSLYALFAMIYLYTSGNTMGAMAYMDEFYFESSAMIVTLITIGKTLESYSKGKTTDAIKSLMALTPPTATLLKNGEEIVTPVEDVVANDEFVLRSGASVPVDGIILSGNGAIDESALTGESVPVDKTEGDKVSQGTIVKSGYLVCRATKVGEDTALSQIIKMVSDANASKAPISKIADKVSGVFVPVVLAIALITTIIWLALGKGAGFALARGITVLVISCPCSLGLATPVAIMVGSGKGAKNGILFKTAESLENIGKVDIVVMDKTGTITKGEPSVTDYYTENGIDKNDLLKYAYSLEFMSEHPLSKAIVDEAQKNNLQKSDVENFAVIPGKGLSGEIDGSIVRAGSKSFIEEYVELSENAISSVENLSAQGKTPLLFAKDSELLGIIAVADTVKEDSIQTIRELRNMGIKVIMLTGDNKNTAEAIGKQVGVDEVIAGVLPDGKEKVVRELQKQGKVAMVGDGINDAPALTSADIGLAIGQGTDVAIDSADVVLSASKMTAVSGAVRLGRRTLVNIYENLFWAFIYNVIGIPLAAGLFTSWFGWELNPMFGAMAMSLSSFCVVMNALRLNFVKVFDPKHDRKKIKKNKKENSIMVKTMKIEGMMCNHCVASVTKALSAVKGVENVEITLENGQAIVTAKESVSEKALKNAVEKAGYKVLLIE